MNISDSHVIMRKGEAWLLGTQIQPLPTATLAIEPSRTRKLLLKKKELNQLIGSIEREGYTLIPLSLYWNKNRIKISIALAKGKKMHDKRTTIKDRDWQRDKSRLMKKPNY